MLCRLGESGLDALTIMKIAGHGSIVGWQRYVHPTPEAVERALEPFNGVIERTVTKVDSRGTSEEVPTTLFTTSADAIRRSHLKGL